MAKITYANKATMNENPDIDAINKVRAVDMNEIKSVVNGLDDSVTDLLGNSIVDFDIGASTGYIKFNNGVLACFVRGTYSGKIDTAFGNGYRSAGFSIPNYPVAFSDQPYTSIRPYCTDGNQGCWAMTGGQPSSTNAGSLYLVRTQTLTQSYNYVVDVIAIGKWK